MASPLVSWTFVLAIVVAGLYIYRPDLFSRLKAQVPQPAAIDSVVRPNNKRTKSKKSTTAKVGENGSVPTSSNEKQANKKRKLAANVNGTIGSTTAASTSEKETAVGDDGDMGDKDFARQLAKTQSGTNFSTTNKDKAKKTQRTTKQTQANALEPSGASTENSSTAGRDADDDLSAAESPAVDLTDKYVEVKKAGDVSDMLEAPAAKPTTLRLTGVTDNDKHKKKPATKVQEPALSKKKRNEMAKKEELRLVREESDRIHEAKKQEQLRRARMAAGTSNQTKANNFTSTANAWKENKQPEAVKAAPAESVPLLDTFDPASSTTGMTNGAVHTAPIPDAFEESNIDSARILKEKVGEEKAAALMAPKREGYAQDTSSWADQMSEEDQMKILKEQQEETAWESVTTKKSKKSKRREGDSGSEASGSVPRAAPVTIRQQPASAKVQVPPKPATSTGRYNAFGTFDSKDAEWEA